MGILLGEQNFRDVWRRNKSVRAEISQILHTHTHTHAAKLVVEMNGRSRKHHIIILYKIKHVNSKYCSQNTVLSCKRNTVKCKVIQVKKKAIIIIQINI